MINYVYCSTNPDQKELAKGFCSYSFVNPVPIYDHYATGDFSKKILNGLTGNTIVQWSEAIEPVNEVAQTDWTYWINEQYVHWLEKGNKPLNVKYLTNCYEIKRRLKKHGKESRALYRGGVVKPIKRKFLDFKKIRIGLYSGHMKHTPIKEIYESLQNGLIKDFELFIKGQGEYKLHDNTLLDSEIKNIEPRINICDYNMADMDVMLFSPIHAETGISQALREGVPVAAIKSLFADDMQMKYNCISVKPIGSISEAITSATSDAIINGREKMSLICNEANMSNIFFENTKLDFKKEFKKSLVNVFGLFRNNEDSIGYTLSGLKAAERKLGLEAKYYFFENDSHDDTPNQIKDFYKHSFGNYECQIMNAKEHKSDSRPDRLRDLAIYRNKMKDLCSDWNSSDYTFIIDSEIKFEFDIFKKLIQSLESYEDCVMVTPFGQPEYNSKYYDTFALRNLDDSQTQPSHESITEVNSAFAGFVCIRTEVFKKCHWEPLADISEHVFFCDMVRQYGKIVIDPTIKVTWKK